METTVLHVINIALICLFFFSFSCNIFQRIKIKALIKAPQPTVDAQRLLQEIMSGTAILKIDVIEPGDILLRSPRG